MVSAAGRITTTTHYQHGEASLNDAIIRMSQGFMGSNQVPLLEPHGQLGSRLANGHDAASPRYVSVALSAAARLLFPEADHPLLPDATCEVRVPPPAQRRRLT